ncbi:acyl-CoA thioesterase [Flavobacteriaceae bacterium XHP0103]|uniref:acyl-CoA thioesterase n=1 Tax=Marixanthotalea marina TaxID=2844359 RepID=UPI002989C4FA|nr:acyl-ACP thioesterase domain-containing protein [Marixanthotalea marina]MBU3821608.1 acyl-CoA thioesterase [Marixanthotalea marina]
MKEFELKLTVNSSHLDEHLHVNNVTYVHWVQDIARKHWETEATKNILANYFWVLTSHYIEYKKEAFLNDTIVLKTYVAKHEGAVSVRIVEIFNKKTNALLVKSETKWCLIDAETKRPTRITPEISNLFM